MSLEQQLSMETRTNNTPKNQCANNGGGLHPPKGTVWYTDITKHDRIVNYTEHQIQHEHNCIYRVTIKMCIQKLQFYNI